jgi:hypothetical protein
MVHQSPNARKPTCAHLISSGIEVYLAINTIVLLLHSQQHHSRKRNILLTGYVLAIVVAQALSAISGLISNEKILVEGLNPGQVSWSDITGRSFVLVTVVLETMLLVGVLISSCECFEY